MKRLQWALNRIRASASQDFPEAPLKLEQMAHAIQRQDNRMTNEPQYQLWEHRSDFDQPVFIDQFFTNTAALRYARINAHNLGETFIYVASGWRNEEWQLVRQLLTELFPLDEDK